MYFPPKCSLQTVVNAEWRIELKINSDSFMTKAEIIMKDSLFYTLSAGSTLQRETMIAEDIH